MKVNRMLSRVVRMADTAREVAAPAGCIGFGLVTLELMGSMDGATEPQHGKMVLLIVTAGVSLWLGMKAVKEAEEGR